MKKIISVILVLFFMFYIIGCSSNGFVNLEEPPIGESVKINLVDGSVKEGVILKKSDTTLKYVDTKTNKPEDLEMSQINTIEYISTVYDLSGNTTEWCGFERLCSRSNSAYFVGKCTVHRGLSY